MTSISVPIVHPRITEYLIRLDAAVASFPHAEASDIVSEIRAHISDALAEDTSDARVDRVLASLGSPELLAENFRTELVFARAAHSFSPRLLLRTVWRWGRSGAKGLAVFFIGLLGYAVGLALTITVLMKPFVSSIGLWVGHGILHLGSGNTEGMREGLGQAYIPVTSVLAFAAVRSKSLHCRLRNMRRRGTL